MKRLLLVVTAVILALAATGLAADTQATTDQDIASLQKLIDQKGYHWKAGRTSVSDLSEAEFMQLLGHKPPKDYQQRLERLPRISANQKMAFPPVFDWRDSSGVTSVKNQGGCGSCWDFAAVGAFEAAIKIHDGIEYDLSEQQAMSCNIYESGCTGGWAEPVYELFQRYGAVLESCLPYQGLDGIPCTQGSCPVVTRLKEWVYVENDVSAIKQALLTGPVYTSFSVYQDFSNYTEGCYQHVTGSYRGGHAVVIVGWDDNACGGGGGAWICKNSWGAGWANLGGYFYIKWGDCGIGSSTVLPIYPADPVTLAYENHQASEASGNGNGILEPGETATLSIDLTNRGLATATAVSATLTALTPGLTVTTPQANFPDIVGGATAESLAPHFTFEIGSSVPAGTKAEFQLAITCDQGSFNGSLYEYLGKFDTAFADDMEGDDNGWTHGGVLDDWAHGQPPGSGLTDPPSAHSGTNIWANSLGGNYQSYAQNYLLSPVVNCSDMKNVRLTYYRWLASEKSVYDSAAIFVNNHLVWIGDSSYDQIDSRWRRHDVDLSAYADSNASVQIKFSLKSDAALQLGGWGIDDLAIVGLSMFVRGDANGDETVNIGDAVHVVNYVFKSGLPPSPIDAGDANCDHAVNIGDAIYVVNYVFKSGPAPSCP